ncbi:MAG TPA: hypothetical protein VHY22_05990 [Chthoniobacteraceae bacterium]|jgi:hypothetical protein|nr:hypothetical protein [Chthoniobacteraceae bacterium]
MNIRPLIITMLLASTPAWARIVVDDSVPEPAAEKPGIQVPGPKGGADNAQTPAAQDSLTFLNKDQLHGILLKIDNSGLSWQSPEAHDPILFKTADLSEIKLDSHHSGNAAKSAERITLTNGDELPGNIVTLDDKTLALDTWYAGRISIPRAMLRRITPLSDSNASLYEGPTGIGDWSVGRMGGGRSWIFRDGALIGNNYGTIGRDMKLPDMSNIEFDLVLRGNSPFSIGLYSDRADNFGNCYMLQLSNGYTELQRFSRLGGSNDLGSTQLQSVMRHEKSHIQLRVNKEKKSIWLIVDDKMVKEWTDPGDFNGAGGNLIFSCQPGTYVRISNIKVSKWDGKFDDSDSPDEKTTDDTVQLANEDKVTGKLESIQDGKAKFSSSYAELNIPLERIEQVDLSGAHTDQAQQGASDVRAYFQEGGSVTMQLAQWDASGCTGSSPNFGKATFSPDAFSRIVFNLSAHQENGAPDDSAADNSGDQGDQ